MRDRRKYVFAQCVSTHLTIPRGFKPFNFRTFVKSDIGCPTLHSDAERFEPSSRTILIGEQPNAWDLLQPRAKVSRHRGAELRRRYGRLGGTSLLSPG